MGSESGGSSSKSLKFGVDRLLSLDDRSSRSGEDRLVDFTPYDYQSAVDEGMTPVLQGQVRASCADCVHSVFRCCARIQQRHIYHPHHIFSAPPLLTSFLHSPKPIRAYPSLVMDREDRVTLGKRKRSWSRAVFSNLQRKGLEKRFQLQKYITKPDRRQLAATLGLTDAQVKVWFQNRRMKWRHTKEMKYHVDSTTSGSSSGKILKRSDPNELTVCPSSLTKVESREEDSQGALKLIHDTS